MSDLFLWTQPVQRSVAASDGSSRNLKLCVPMSNYWAESGQRQYRVIVSLYYSWLKHCGNYTLMTSLSDQLTTTITHLITACLCALWSCPQFVGLNLFWILFAGQLFRFVLSIIFQYKRYSVTCWSNDET